MRFTRNVCLMAVAATTTFSSAGRHVVVDAIPVNDFPSNPNQGLDVGGQDECFHFGGRRAISGGSANSAKPFVVVSDVPVILNRISDGFSSNRGTGPPWPVSTGVTFVVKSDCSNDKLLSSDINPTVEFNNINGFNGQNGNVAQFTIQAIPPNTSASDLNDTFLNSSTYTLDRQCTSCENQGGGGNNNPFIEICKDMPTLSFCADLTPAPTSPPTPAPTRKPIETQPICENPVRRLRSSNNDQQRRELDVDMTCTINVEITYWGCENEVFVDADHVIIKDNDNQNVETMGCNCQSQLTFVDIADSPSPPEASFNIIETIDVDGTSYQFIKGGEGINPNCPGVV